MAGGQPDHVLAAGVDDLLSQRVLEAGVDMAHLFLEPHVLGDAGGEAVDARGQAVQPVGVLRQRGLQLGRHQHRMDQLPVALDQHRRKGREDEAQEQHRQNGGGDPGQFLVFVHSVSFRESGITDQE